MEVPIIQFCRQADGCDISCTVCKGRITHFRDNFNDRDVKIKQLQIISTILSNKANMYINTLNGPINYYTSSKLLIPRIISRITVTSRIHCKQSRTEAPEGPRSHRSFSYFTIFKNIHALINIITTTAAATDTTASVAMVAMILPAIKILTVFKVNAYILPLSLLNNFDMLTELLLL
jgi:hypothetical protein